VRQRTDMSQEQETCRRGSRFSSPLQVRSLTVFRHTPLLRPEQKSSRFDCLFLARGTSVSFASSSNQVVHVPRPGGDAAHPPEVNQKRPVGPEESVGSERQLQPAEGQPNLQRLLVQLNCCVAVIEPRVEKLRMGMSSTSLSSRMHRRSRDGAAVDRGQLRRARLGRGGTSGIGEEIVISLSSR
jgi:hypothetical protein